MNQPAPDQRVDQRRHESRLASLARYFRARPGQWIDARILAQVGGLLAWRTRVSELRRAPYLLAIENRTRCILTTNGRTVTVSEYCLVESPR